MAVVSLALDPLAVALESAARLALPVRPLARPRRRGSRRGPRTWLLNPSLAGLLLLALPVSVAAQAGETTPPASSEGASQRGGDDVSRARERVLHLSGGGVARCRCRLVGAAWELERKTGEPQLLPAAEVVRAEPVSELLAEAERRSARLKPTDADGRAAHAAWLATAGLVPECVAELDRVLALAPAHHGARELLETQQLSIALPPLSREHLSPEDGLRSYVRLAGLLGPAGRALAARELAAAPPPDVDVLAVLTAALVDASVPTRAFAARALGRMFPGRAVDALYRRAILDVQEAVRIEAALALSAVGHEAIVLPALSALESEHGAVRAHAADALALLGFPHAVPALVAALAAPAIGGSTGISGRGHIVVTNELAYVQDVDVEIAQGASIADPIISSISEGVMLDGRVLGMQLYTLQIQELHIRRALEQLTGVDPGRTNAAWAKWWDEHGDGFVERLNAE